MPFFLNIDEKKYINLDRAVEVRVTPDGVMIEFASDVQKLYTGEIAEAICRYLDFASIHISTESPSPVRYAGDVQGEARHEGS